MTARTLLLTPWYIPIQVLHWQDAIKMVYEETVVVVVECDEEVRSPSITWKMPAVVRLRKLKRDRAQSSVKFSRVNVYARDGHRCQYCGERFDEAELSYDHVVPRYAGGDILPDVDVPDALAPDVALNALVRERRTEFQVPEVERRELPSPAAIEANKERWGLGTPRG